jgi:hypothetical protein
LIIRILEKNRPQYSLRKAKDIDQQARQFLTSQNLVLELEKTMKQKDWKLHHKLVPLLLQTEEDKGLKQGQKYLLQQFINPLQQGK